MGNILYGIGEVPMPWKVSTHMNERKSLAFKYFKGDWTMKSLCQEYGISRKTGYKWLKRFITHGEAGLLDRSRRPKRTPHQTPESLVVAIIAKKHRHPKWGPKKLKCLLEKDGMNMVPSESTLGRILQRYGLVKHRRRRAKTWPNQAVLTQPMYPNHVWAVDFKGWFKTRDGKKCEPLTISDLYSRYIIACVGLEEIKTHKVQEIFKRVFHQYGLPLIIRSDNGVPFSHRSIAGLSRLSIWWFELGIEPELIKPGHPEQNPEHERMHRTLKLEILDDVGRTIIDQQRHFDKWRKTYNTIRPHESIGMKCPADLYEKSPRKYNGNIKIYEYPEQYLVRTVKQNGDIRWKMGRTYVARVLSNRKVGLKPRTPIEYELYFRTKKLGIIKTGCTSVLPMS